MLRRTLTFTLLVAGIASASAIESITAATPEGRRVTVTAITPNILRVSNIAPGEQPLPSTATVLTPATGSAIVGTAGEFIATLTTSTGIHATIDKRTGFLTITAGAGKVLTDDGSRLIADGRNHLSLATTSRGSVYGAGERAHALDLRGDTLRMWNRPTYGYGHGDSRISQMNVTMPLFLSSDGYAIVFDDHARADMLVGDRIEYVSDNTRPIAYYYVNGATTLADVTESLTALTGRQPLPPLWTLGYITSRYGYRTQAETLAVVDSLKRDGYPLDGIVLDLYWYGKEQDMGSLAWEPSQWPEPEKMLRRLKARGINLVAISQPFVLRNGRGLDNFNTLSAEHLLLCDSTGATEDVKIWVGEGGMFDVSNPATRRWLTDRYKLLTDQGIEGWWGDLGEPEAHPLSALHANGQGAIIYHNQYGNDWSQIIYDLFRREYPNRRLMAMMRAGTTGLQRYSVFPWSGDVSRSWAGLQPQVRIMINSGLSGLAYMSHDVGGFAIDPSNPLIPELYVRWLQLGLFSPVLRTHAQQYAEPYNYPEHAAVIHSLINARYRWLPYNYTLAYENSAFGYPLVRPLNFAEAGSNAYDDIFDEYLWGSQVLVAPVMEPAVTSRQVTFPEGQWLDMSDPAAVIAGHSTITCDAPIDVIPTFVRAGAFIPMATYKMENTGDYDPSHLTVNYYPVKGVESQFTMYDDDRTSPDALATGQYRLITFKGSADGAHITVEAHGTYPGAPDNVDMEFIIHRAADTATFRVNGRNVKARYNATDGTLRLRLRWPVNRQLVIDSPNLNIQ